MHFPSDLGWKQHDMQLTFTVFIEYKYRSIGAIFNFNSVFNFSSEFNIRIICLEFWELGIMSISLFIFENDHCCKVHINLSFANNWMSVAVFTEL